MLYLKTFEKFPYGRLLTCFDAIRKLLRDFLGYYCNSCSSTENVSSLKGSRLSRKLELTPLHTHYSTHTQVRFDRSSNE